MTRADVNLEAVHELHRQGLSIRAIAKRLGLSRMMVQRILATPVVDDDDDESDDELMERLAGMDVADSSVLTPPFDFSGVEDGAVRWRDANGVVFGELDLYWWGQRVNEIIPGDYATEGEYLASVDATDAEIEAVNAHAWASVDAAAVVYDDARHRWVQRPRAV